MVAVTYDVARVSAADATAPAAPRKSWFTRFIDALIAARMEQARSEIRIHTGLLPYTLDERGNRLIKTSVSDMPFGV